MRLIRRVRDAFDLLAWPILTTVSAAVFGRRPTGADEADIAA